jgi:hypothetical protein
MIIDTITTNKYDTFSHAITQVACGDRYAGLRSVISKMQLNLHKCQKTPDRERLLAILNSVSLVEGYRLSTDIGADVKQVLDQSTFMLGNIVETVLIMLKEGAGNE